MTSSRLQLGLREKDRPSTYHYESSLFERDGRYGGALNNLANLFGGGCYSDWSTDGRKLALQIIHQCEEALRWRELDKDSARDLVEYFDTVSETFSDAASLVSKLRVIEGRHSYFFRHAFRGAIEPLIPDATPLDVQLPDANHPDGGPTHKADAATQRYIQHTLIWKMSLFQLPELLEGLEKGLRDRRKLDAPFRQVACLMFDPPLSRKACSKLHADIVGLGGWLSYFFREWTAGRGVHAYWPGTEMPNDGMPKWNLVADFVNASLEPITYQTGDTMRQAWHSLTKQRSVRLHDWPVEPLREPQVI